MIEILKAVLYGIVEGITEWLPVSSTGHLILLDEFLALNVSPDAAFRAEFGQMFEVVIQLGAILAVAVSFFKVLWPFGAAKSAEEKKSTWRLWLNICIASIPAAAVGIVLDKVIENATGKDIDGWIYNATVVASALIIYGVLFILIERFRGNKSPSVTSVHDIKPKHAIFIGIFQMLAIIPGTSRSGSTILGSMMLGLSRGAAAEFSFFLAIPAMAGASLLKGLGFVSYVADSGADVTLTAVAVLAVASITAFLVSMAAIKFLTDFVKKHSFAVFGYYRIILGAAVLLYFIFN